MDAGIFGRIDFSMEFVTAFLTIVLIDLVLAGDNAVVIAMAIRTLPKEKRFFGLLAGAGGAVLLRVICTFVVAKFLVMPYVKLAGGAVITWIGIKLMVDCAEEEECKKEASTVLQALWIIVVADVSMSIDNMLAVGAASKGNVFLLIFGLMLSIPFVVFTSNLICMLMERYPIILWLGAAILGKVGGDMMISDPFIVNLIHPSKVTEYGVMIFFVAMVVVTSKIILKKRAKRAGAGVLANCDGDRSDAPR